MEITDEIWKPIEGFSYYEISSRGRVRTKERVVRNGQGPYIKRERLLKLQDNGLGYKRICVRENDVKKFLYIHRLVAQAFIPNPENKPCVNHIDNNPENNTVENLEWCTKQENTDWMVKQGRNKRNSQWISRLHTTQAQKFYKPVIGTNMRTGEQIYFDHLNSVKTCGFDVSCVCWCCKGKRNFHKGYFWRYGDDVSKEAEKKAC